MKHTNKKLWALLVAVIALVVLCAFAASAEVVGGDCGVNGGNVTWSYNTESKALTISGTGEMRCFKYDKVPWNNYANQIQTVSIDESITVIGNYAFYNCSSLSAIVIPENVSVLGAYAFSGCTSLLSVSFPDGLSVIGPHAFSGCTSLDTVEIPNTITRIGYWAFENCTSLNTISLPEKGISFGGSTFAGTAYYNEPTNWEDGVLYIGKHLVDTAQSVSGNYTIKEGTKSIAFDVFPSNNNLTGVILNPELETAYGSFMNSGIESIALPDDLTRISSMLYFGTNVENIVVPNSVTSIGTLAFIGTPSLQTIRLGRNIQSMGLTPFDPSILAGIPGVETSLTTIYTCMSEEEWNEIVNEPITYAEVLAVSGDETLSYQEETSFDASEIPELPLVPDGVEIIFDYHTLDATNAYCTFCGKTFTGGYCGAEGDGKNLEWNYDVETKTLVISGEGEMDDFSQNNSPWNAYCDEIKDVSIGTGVTSVGSYAFIRCSALKSINLPSSITSIGMGAFGDTVSLEQLIIPANIVSAPGIFAGVNMSGLETIVFEEGLKKIDLLMLAMTNLKNVILPNSVETIDALAFLSPELDTIRIGSNLKEIGYAACNPDFWEVFTQGQVVIPAPNTIYTCLTEEEWDQSVVIRDRLTNRETSFLSGINADNTPDLNWIPDTTEVIYDSHLPGEYIIENTVTATCMEQGRYDKVTYCTLCGKEIRETVEIEDDPSLGHNFEPAWTWSDDGSVATVDFNCSRCDESFTKRATVTRTEQDNGSILCTATVTYDNVEYTDTKIVQPGTAPVDPGTGGGNGGGSGNGNGGSGSGGSGGVTIKGRCSMCDFAANYKNVPVAGWIIAIVHFFIHMTSQIRYIV